MKKIEIDNKAVIVFTRSARAHLKIMDKLMAMPPSVEKGKEIAKEMNRFNFDLDAFMHFSCKIPLNKLDGVLKPKFNLLMYWK